MLAWIEALVAWLRDADNRGVVTVLVSTMALLLSVIAYIWPRKPRESIEKEKDAATARERKTTSSKPLSQNTPLVRGLAMGVGVLAMVGMGYGIFKAFTVGRDEVTLHYSACLGEYERNCGFSHDVYLYCYADAGAYIKEKEKCLRVEANAIASHDGNKCGYTNVSVICVKAKP